MKITFPLLSLCLLFACSPTEKNEKEEYYALDDFDKVEKIDTHIHIYTERDDFFDQAKKDNFKLVNIVVDNSKGIEYVKEEFKLVNYQAQTHPEDIVSITAFSAKEWDDPNWAKNSMDWLDSCFDAGAIGIKVWKNVGMVQRDSAGNLVMVDDPKLDTIFQELTQREIPVIGHLGEPKNCWLPVEEMTTNNDKRYFSEHPQYHMYKQPDMPSYEEQIAARDNMLEKNPQMIFVGAHVGSLEWSVDELAKRLDEFPNMAVDLAARMGQIFYQSQENREKVRDFFIKYQDRVTYATDAGDDGEEDPADMQEELHKTWLRDWQYFTTDDTMTSDLIEGEFQALHLPKDVVDKIFRENAKQWFGIFQ